ncbi:MAG: hypothetical protein ABW185_10780 [Sedimenticola sp.]
MISLMKWKSQIPAGREPISVAQALLLYVAWIYFDKPHRRAWEWDFFHVLALVIDDLRKDDSQDAKSLIMTLEAYFKTGSRGKLIPSIQRWRDESDLKVDEGWINDSPIYHFNNTGEEIAQRINNNNWGTFFEPEVIDYFTISLRQLIKRSIRNYPKRKNKISELYYQRFPEEAGSGDGHVGMNLS